MNQTLPLKFNPSKKHLQRHLDLFKQKSRKSWQFHQIKASKQNAGYKYPMCILSQNNQIQQPGRFQVEQIHHGFTKMHWFQSPAGEAKSGAPSFMEKGIFILWNACLVGIHFKINKYKQYIHVFVSYIYTCFRELYIYRLCIYKNR